MYKKCKYCQSEIDVNAKICPHCRKKQGKPIVRIVLLSILGFIILMMIIGNLGSSNSSSSGSNNTQSVAEIKQPKAIAVGDVKVKRIDIFGSDFGCEITGTVSNISGQDLQGIEVIVNLYDKNGSYIGTEKITLEEGLPINKSWRFEISSLEDAAYSSDIKEINAW